MPNSMLLMRDSSGPAVQALKACLVTELGPDAAAFPGLSAGDLFDSNTEAALRRWQAGTGLTADGIAGPHCFTLLHMRQQVKLELAPDLPAMRELFPQTKPSNIVRYLPYVTDALEAAGLTDRAMMLAALGTIRAETAGFVPISEYPSRYNTLPGQPPFSTYEPGNPVAHILGNTLVGDGARYRGRGFVQLTGSDNYHRYTIETGIDIASQPELANSPEVAAMLLALFLSQHADDMRANLAAGNYVEARSLVFYESRGLKGFKKGDARNLRYARLRGLVEFKSIFVLAEKLWPGAVPVGKGRPPTARTVRARDTRKDPPDLRDRLFQPPVTPLPNAFPLETDVKTRFKDYRQLVLDQKQDSSCTGYGLACVINFARWAKSGWQASLPSVSARMLYNFARRYDEYAGEDYEGSSCRGALKGWFYHGVCVEADWPDHARPRYGYAQRATQITLGVYYRIDIKSIADMQAAIMQSHAIYVSAYTHDGWEKLDVDPPLRGLPTHANLPLIEFDGKASKAGGHAFALVGFNSRGFIVQNSWGESFGLGGFAVLSYADWLANGMDAWVAALGVPGVVEGRLSSRDAPGAAAMAGDSGPWQARWWDEGTAYEHSIVTGEDGRVMRYLTQDELSRSLLYQACALPDQWFRTDPVAGKSKVKRLVIYAHGGLNSEKDAIARARAMGRYFTGNGCYPLFLVWKTGLLESLEDIVSREIRNAPGQVGGAFDSLFEATDLLIEKTIGRGPARRIWSEMKTNAEFSCTSSRGCDLLANALQNLAASWGPALEIHLVGHSAGSILLGHLLEVLSVRQVIDGSGPPRKLSDNIATSHLFAPACTVQFANRHYATHNAVMQRLWMHILTDEQERDDNVAAIYRKSLLYLVSDALEPDVRTPILGLENIRKPTYTGWDGSSTTTEALGSWRDAVRSTQLDQRTTIVSQSRVPQWVPPKGKPDTIPATHGSFDNNVEIISATLQRITGKALALPVDDLRGF